MADTVKAEGSVKWDLDFVDGDTRTVSLKNPKPDITLADITTAMSDYGTIFAGDKTGADYSGFSNPRKVEVTTRLLDLS